VDEDTADSAWETRVKELRTRIRRHPGQLAEIKWEGLRRVADVLGRNLRELLMVLEAPNRDVQLALELIQNVRRSDIRDDYFAVLDQRLHNFVASATTLIDHTRRHVDGYQGTAFAREYENRKVLVTDAPVASFVKSLRNYLLHYRLPLLGHRVSFKSLEIAPGSIDFRIEASTDLLLEWDGWRGRARSYLEHAGEVVDVRAAVVEYGRLVQDLYQWIFEQFPALHAAEIAQLNALRSEYNNVLRGEPENGVETSPEPY
jgi:hypothetical protein